MSDKETSTRVEHPVPAKKNKSCMRHCKRFWWVYLLVFIVVVVLAVTLIILVAVPKLAQSKLDESELQVDGISVTQTRANSYVMGINSTVRSSGGVSAKIAPFSAEMYLEDLEPHTPFVHLEFPETTSAELQTVNVTGKEITITDMAAFTTFNTWLLSNDSIRVTILGETTVRVSGIARDYGVTYKKTFELTGLNHFHGLEVTKAEISLTPDDNGDNFKGTVDIPNPSVLTIEIGDTSFNTYLGDEFVGISYIDNLVLYPGINSVSMHANVTQAPVLTAVGERPACEDGIVDFKLDGRDVVNGGDDLAYFSDALSSNNLTVGINIGQALKDLGVELGCSDTKTNSTATRLRM